MGKSNVVMGLIILFLAVTGYQAITGAGNWLAGVLNLEETLFWIFSFLSILALVMIVWGLKPTDIVDEIND